jgi:hypothetical protein
MSFENAIGLVLAVALLGYPCSSCRSNGVVIRPL